MKFTCEVCNVEMENVCWFVCETQNPFVDVLHGPHLCEQCAKARKQDGQYVAQCELCSLDTELTHEMREQVLAWSELPPTRMRPFYSDSVVTDPNDLDEIKKRYGPPPGDKG